MPHIHELIDEVVSLFVVHRETESILLVNHRKLDMWLPPGGHIELHELPDEAARRELKEETGLEIGKTAMFRLITGWHIWLKVRHFDGPQVHNARLLVEPWFTEVHDFGADSKHRHVCRCYLVRALVQDKQLEEEAHSDIRWFTKKELQDLDEKARQDLHLADHIHGLAIEAIDYIASVENKVNEIS